MKQKFGEGKPETKADDRMEAYKKKFAEKNKGKVATGIPSKPNITLDIQWYLDAFGRLTTSRQMGMSIGYIPLSEIITYAEKVGCIEDDVECFIDVMQQADRIFVDNSLSK